MIGTDGMGYVYFSGFLPLTKPVFIQWPDARNRIRCCLKLGPNDLEKTDAKSAADSQSITIYNLRNESEPSFAAYKIKPKLPHTKMAAFAGMAIASNKVAARSPYHIVARTNNKKLSARICFGTEGKNLIAKEDREYQLLYMNFGYSINQKPKCNDREQRILESATLN